MQLVDLSSNIKLMFAHKGQVGETQVYSARIF